LLITVEKNVDNLFWSTSNPLYCLLKFVIGTSFNLKEMFGTILRKKVTDEKLANVFINGLFSTIDNVFPIIAELINEDPVFVSSPGIKPGDSYEFSIIVFVANINFIESSFDQEQADRVQKLIHDKLSKVYDIPLVDLKKMFNEYKSLMDRLNHPSKNTIYAMSKGIFDKYALYNFQDEYFKRMQAPNPLFLKRMDEIIENFIWDWDNFFKKFRLD